MEYLRDYRRLLSPLVNSVPFVILVLTLPRRSRE